MKECRGMGNFEGFPLSRYISAIDWAGNIYWPLLLGSDDRKGVEKFWGRPFFQQFFWRLLAVDEDFLFGKGLVTWVKKGLTWFRRGRYIYQFWCKSVSQPHGRCLSILLLFCPCHIWDRLFWDSNSPYISSLHLLGAPAPLSSRQWGWQISHQADV